MEQLGTSKRQSQSGWQCGGNAPLKGLIDTLRSSTYFPSNPPFGKTVVVPYVCPNMTANEEKAFNCALKELRNKNYRPTVPNNPYNQIRNARVVLPWNFDDNQPYDANGKYTTESYQDICRGIKAECGANPAGIRGASVAVAWSGSWMEWTWDSTTGSMDAEKAINPDSGVDCSTVDWNDIRNNKRDCDLVGGRVSNGTTYLY